MLADAGLLDQAPAELRSPIQVDNKGAIDIANGEAVTKRSKHIEVRFHMVQDLVKKGKIRLTYVPSGKNAADGLTKPLSNERYIEFRS